MGLNAGQLDREVTYQTATKTQDPDTGEELIDWDDVAEETIWAEWLPGNTREGYQASQRLSAQVDGVFRIYYRLPRPDPAVNRIIFDGDTYDLKPAVEVRRAEGWEIPAVTHG